jgi:HSP20 family molecular chaperone IbpA
MRKKSSADVNKEIDKSKNLVLIINLPQVAASIKNIELKWHNNFLEIDGYCRQLKHKICLYEFHRRVNLKDLKDKLDLQNFLWYHFPEKHALQIIIPFKEEKVNSV